MVYLHPLAYLVGLEGVAVLRAFAGEHDRSFIEARLAEVRALLDAGTGDRATEARLITVAETYRAWAQCYDEPGNGLFEPEQAVVSRPGTSRLFARAGRERVTCRDGFARTTRRARTRAA